MQTEIQPENPKPPRLERKVPAETREKEIKPDSENYPTVDEVNSKLRKRIEDEKMLRAVALGIGESLRKLSQLRLEKGEQDPDYQNFKAGVEEMLEALAELAGKVNVPIDGIIEVVGIDFKPKAKAYRPEFKPWEERFVEEYPKTKSVVEEELRVRRPQDIAGPSDIAVNTGAPVEHISSEEVITSRLKKVKKAALKSTTSFPTTVVPKLELEKKRARLAPEEEITEAERIPSQVELKGSALEFKELIEGIRELILRRFAMEGVKLTGKESLAQERLKIMYSYIAPEFKGKSFDLITETDLVKELMSQRKLIFRSSVAAESLAILKDKVEHLIAALGEADSVAVDRLLNDLTDKLDIDAQSLKYKQNKVKIGRLSADENTKLDLDAKLQEQVGRFIREVQNRKSEILFPRIESYGGEGSQAAAE